MMKKMSLFSLSLLAVSPAFAEEAKVNAYQLLLSAKQPIKVTADTIEQTNVYTGVAAGTALKLALTGQDAPLNTTISSECKAPTATRDGLCDLSVKKYIDNNEASLYSEVVFSFFIRKTGGAIQVAKSAPITAIQKDFEGTLTADVLNPNALRVLLRQGNMTVPAIVDEETGELQTYAGKSLKDAILNDALVGFNGENYVASFCESDVADHDATVPAGQKNCTVMVSNLPASIGKEGRPMSQVVFTFSILPKKNRSGEITGWTVKRKSIRTFAN